MKALEQPANLVVRELGLLESIAVSSSDRKVSPTPEELLRAEVKVLSEAVAMLASEIRKMHERDREERYYRERGMMYREPNYTFCPVCGGRDPSCPHRMVWR